MQVTKSNFIDAEQLEAASEFVQSTTGMIVVGLALAVFVLASCRIVAKAGFRAEAGLLMLLPGVNVLLFLWLAFFPWPLAREARQLRKMQKAVHRADERHQRRSAA